jgi:hypothetical protein
VATEVQATTKSFSNSRISQPVGFNVVSAGNMRWGKIEGAQWVRPSWG